MTDPTHFAVTARQLIDNLKPEGTDMTTAILNLAADIAPVPTSRDQATREAWIRHHAAQAAAAYVTLRLAIRGLPANPIPGSRPDIGFLATFANAAVAAAAALTDPADAPGLIYDLTPEAGAINGEWEDWLNDTLAEHGINPADIDPDLDPAGFADAVAAAQDANEERP